MVVMGLFERLGKFSMWWLKDAHLAIMPDQADCKDGRRGYGIVRILLPLLVVVTACRADVPFVAYREGRFLANGEFLVSIEPTFKQGFSLPLWTGFALVWPLQGENGSKGWETAVELRKSFGDGPHFSNFFTSAYVGLARMEVTEYYRGKAIGHD
ncbi:MAG: hypothetical protein GF344_20430 [Chitinivibrionales bacterium]|nr:hypothetical protein [Chitinivibrionales bacterium]